MEVIKKEKGKDYILGDVKYGVVFRNYGQRYFMKIHDDDLDDDEFQCVDIETGDIFFFKTTEEIKIVSGSFIED